MDVGTVLRQEGRALWSKGRGPSLVAVATGWGLLVGTRMIYPVIIPYFESSFGLSLALAGLLVSVLWLCGALGQLPGGLLADRYDERWIMGASVLIVALALVFVVTAAEAWVLFAATALWGIGHSLYPISRITFLSTSYSSRLGSALGVTMATGDIGQTVLPPIAAVLAAALAWQAGLGFVVPFLVLAGLGILIAVPRQPSRGSVAGARSLQNPRRVFAEIRTPAIGFMSAILLLFIFIWQSFTAFYPTYLITVKGLSPALASVLFGFFFAVGVVVKPVAGAAYDRIGMRWSLAGVLTPSVVGFGLLPFVDSIWFLVATTALISIMLGTGAITQSFLAESFSKEVQGTGLGVVRTTTATLGAGGPFVFGVVGEYGYFDEGYLALAAIMVVVILLTLRMPRYD